MRPQNLRLLLFADLFIVVFLLWGNYQISHIIQSQKNTEPQAVSLVPSVEVLGQENQNGLALDRIFDKVDESLAYPPEKIRTLIATGDVMLGRAVNARSVREKKFQWPLEKTADYLATADLTLVNLESPFGPSCPVTSEGMKFCTDPAHVDGLKLAGVDVVNLANNHFFDQGQAGAALTKDTLKINGFSTSGWGETVFRNIRGLSFGFLGYCPVCSGEESLEGADRERLALEVEAARKSADIIIVSFHWGEEYHAEPSAIQRELAHAAIDLGADLVIGHHPHWVQPVEIYRGKLIIYSLGNFVFDQMWSAETKVGLVGRFTFFDNRLIDVEFKPVKIETLGQPEWLTEEESRQFLDSLRKKSLVTP